MSRAIYLLLITLLIVSCEAQERTIQNPDIDSTYIKYSSEISSIRDSGFITPVYSITFRNVSDSHIVRLVFDVIYYYGQTFEYSDRKTVKWENGSKEIDELNNEKKTTLRVSLQQIRREALKVITTEETYTKPDGEVLDIGLWSLTITPKRP